MTAPPSPPPLPPAPAVLPVAAAPSAPRRWPKRLLITFLVVVNLGIFGALGAVWYAARRVTSSVATLPSEGLGLAESPSDLSDPRVRRQGGLLQRDLVRLRGAMRGDARARRGGRSRG